MNHVLKVLPRLSVCLLSARRSQSEDRFRTASRWRRPATRARGVAGLLRWMQCICGRFHTPPPPMHSCDTRSEWSSSNYHPMNPPVYWHRPKPVFRGLPPLAYSFHVLQSVFECLACKRQWCFPPHTQPLFPPLLPAPEQWRGFITPPPPGTQSVCTRLPHIHCPIGTNVSLNRQHRQDS